MGLFDNIALGLSVAVSPANLMWCFVGVTLGTFVGVLPGIGSLVAVALLLPVTFHLDPTAALVMLAGVFYGSAYGGSTASILLNLPGTPATAVTALDGYPMSQQGRAGVALLMTTLASFVGASMGIIIMMLFSPLIVDVAIEFGAPEYFSMMVLGLIAAASIATDNPLKGIAMVVLGVTLGIVGTDMETGAERFTFGFAELFEGISLVAIAMGVFGVSEVVASIRKSDRGEVKLSQVTFRSMIPTREDWRRSRFAILRGSGIGSFFGALPGTGGVMASFMAYLVEKKIAREPERFGKGAIEGIVSPEAANNAADQTAFIPTLTLGIPGNVITALMIGTLIVHGIVPGPQMVNQHPDLFWGLIMSFWIGNVLLIILNVPLIGIWIRVLTIPYHLLYPAILVFVCLGVYSVGNSAFDVVLVALFGFVGYVMRLLDFQPAPLLIAFVLGPLLEENLRRALILAGGDFAVFVEQPISAGFLLVAALLLGWALFNSFVRRRPALAVDD